MNKVITSKRERHKNEMRIRKSIAGFKFDFMGILDLAAHRMLDAMESTDSSSVLTIDQLFDESQLTEIGETYFENAFYEVFEEPGTNAFISIIDLCSDLMGEFDRQTFEYFANERAVERIVERKESQESIE